MGEIMEEKTKKTRKKREAKPEESVSPALENKSEEAKEPETKKKPKSLEVTVTKRGFIYGQLRKPEEKLTLETEEDFTPTWMAWGSVEVPEPKIVHANVRKQAKKKPLPEFEKTFDSASIEQLRKERNLD